jgi:hypothetical protein
MNYQLVVTSMFIYIALSQVVPKVITKSTGVSAIDDTVTLLISQQNSIVPGAILAGLVTFLTMYVTDA